MRKKVNSTYGSDVERIIKSISDIVTEAVNQVKQISLDYAYRMETISHSHNVHVGDMTGSPEGALDGDHVHPPAGSPLHAHAINLNLTGNSPTGGSGHVGYVSDQLTYPSEYLADDQHKDISPSIIYEKEHPMDPNTYSNTILLTLGKNFAVDVGSVQTIEKNLYTNKTLWHNSSGSPYQEIYNLKNVMDIVSNFITQHSRLQWLSEKMGLTNALQMILPVAIDAKYAVITYHDDLQRGFDSCINGKKASITWNDFQDGTTNGNIKQ